MKPIRADITLRIHGGEIVASVSDGEEVSVHRAPRGRRVDILEGAAGEVAIGPDGADGAGEEAAEADSQ